MNAARLIFPGTTTLAGVSGQDSYDYEKLLCGNVSRGTAKSEDPKER